MKKQIDLRKRCAESDKICAYFKIGYRPIDDWNELMPIVQLVADEILGLHDGSYCDADILCEHGFVNLLYKDVTYVRNIVCNTIDWLHKQNRTVVHGCLYRLTVKNLYEHKELRDALVNEQIHHVSTHAYVWMEKGDGGQVWSFFYDKETDSYKADFEGNYFESDTCIDLIEKMYDEAGYPVEVKIVFQA